MTFSALAVSAMLWVWWRTYPADVGISRWCKNQLGKASSVCLGMLSIELFDAEGRGGSTASSASGAEGR